MKYLIVTADDFGLADEVNRAVEIAHVEGVLTAASLMVGARRRRAPSKQRAGCPGSRSDCISPLSTRRPFCRPPPPPTLSTLMDDCRPTWRGSSRRYPSCPSSQANAGGDPRPVRGLPRDRA